MLCQKTKITTYGKGYDFLGLRRSAPRRTRHKGKKHTNALVIVARRLARFLIGLSRTPLRERLAFKGGTATQAVLLWRLQVL